MFSRLLRACAALSLASALAMAQEPIGNIAGTGLYLAPALPAGEYDVRAQLTTAVDRQLTVGTLTEVVTVTGAASQIAYDSHKIDGVISSVNFDLSTGIAAGVAVNIVSRSGGNRFHGSGYCFFRARAGQVFGSGGPRAFQLGDVLR